MQRMENIIEKRGCNVEKVLEIVWLGISLEIHFGLGILDFLIACKRVDVKLRSECSSSGSRYKSDLYVKIFHSAKKLYL